MKYFTFGAWLDHSCMIDRLEDEPRGDVFPEAPFRIGPHLHVVRHETHIQCRDCGQQTGKVNGNYNFADLNRQDCRPLKKRKVKKRPTGFAAAATRVTGLAEDLPAGGATGSAFLWRASLTGGQVVPGSWAVR
eukprot:991815-Amphidinium_carterae.4